MDMQISRNGVDFIKQWEGRYLQAYDDATGQPINGGEPIEGTLTIGWGHTTDAGNPEVYPGMRITEHDAELILLNDILKVENQVNRLVTVQLNQNQFDALVSFQFNTGWLEHEHCSLLTALNAHNYDLADEDFSLYNHANGVIIRGLTARRAAERALFAKKESTEMSPTPATTQAITDILKLLQALDPAFAAIPGVGPWLPVINVVIPLTIKAIDQLSQQKGISQVAAIDAVVNHMTAGKPNEPSLNG